MFGSATLTEIAERLRVPHEVIEPTFDRLVGRRSAPCAPADELWLTQAGAKQVDALSAAHRRPHRRQAGPSPTFEGRPDRDEVEAALERIAHRMLVQRDWTDDRSELTAAR